MSDDLETVIEVRGLRSVFGTQVVHDGLDIDVFRGEVLGVIGGSGAGKSVLLRSIVGLKDPDGGQIRFFGEDTTHLRAEQRQPIERRFGLMFQDGALFSSLTVLENVKVPLIEYYQLPDDLVDEIALLKIRLTGLPAEAASKYPGQLSGGMQATGFAPTQLPAWQTSVRVQALPSLQAVPSGLGVGGVHVPVDVTHVPGEWH